ncbi:MAG: SRPBCC family protein [Deltaproteobacteria bacterium]|nr:SRPBCC family protein [Deltaproteobacteria bacterium]
MPIFEDRVLTDTIEINTTPEKVFQFLTGIVDSEGYRAWHKKDHVAFRFIKGTPWTVGSVVVAEEYIHGKLHKLKFVVTKVVTNEKIEYAPTSWLLRKYFPHNEFTIEPQGEGCRFIASGTYRIGWIGKTLFKKKLEEGLSRIQRHMKEEGENLKRILESGV